jgi:SAM-dependent methyltransferase
VEFCRKAGRPVEEADIRRHLSSHPAEYDAIILNDVIEHFTKKEAFGLFGEVFQGLKPGGRFILKTPNMGCPLYASRGRYCDFTHEMGVTEKSLESLYRASGFVNCRALGADVYTSRSALFNLAGRLCWKALKTFYRGLYRLYGHRERSVLTRVLIGVGNKPHAS